LTPKWKALTRAFGVDAYSEARQRKLQAESAAEAREWRAVARAIAHKTGRRHGLDTATRMAMNADFTHRSGPDTSQQLVDQAYELIRTLRKDR
jgi:hypothetical protein